MTTAGEKECVRHGKHEQRKCPACVWCESYPSNVRHESGCPMCGRSLHSNGLIMCCTEDDCAMQTTSHAPPPPERGRVRPEDGGCAGAGCDARRVNEREGPESEEQRARPGNSR